MNLPTPRYLATINEVREVILFGTADAAFWRERLSQEGLTPFAGSGRAELSISATQLRWMGMHPREITLSVAVADRANAGKRAGFYLAHAYNSSRLLAFTERAFFLTPYQHAHIQVGEHVPACIQLRDGHDILLDARMSGGTRRLRSEDESWEGAILLPRRANGVGHQFFARLGGYTETYPFEPTDTLALTPRPGHPVFQWLVASNFNAQEWRIRASATHARSKTYARS